MIKIKQKCDICGVMSSDGRTCTSCKYDAARDLSKTSKLGIDAWKDMLEDKEAVDSVIEKAIWTPKAVSYKDYEPNVLDKWREKREKAKDEVKAKFEKEYLQYPATADNWRTCKLYKGECLGGYCSSCDRYERKSSDIEDAYYEKEVTVRKKKEELEKWDEEFKDFESRRSSGPITKERADVLLKKLDDIEENLERIKKGKPTPSLKTKYDDYDDILDPKAVGEMGGIEKWAKKLNDAAKENKVQVTFPKKRIPTDNFVFDSWKDKSIKCIDNKGFESHFELYIEYMCVDDDGKEDVDNMKIIGVLDINNSLVYIKRNKFKFNYLTNI